MANKGIAYQQTLHLEFLKALHDEKIKTQGERPQEGTGYILFAL